MTPIHPQTYILMLMLIVYAWGYNHGVRAAMWPLSVAIWLGFASFLGHIFVLGTRPTMHNYPLLWVVIADFCMVFVLAVTGDFLLLVPWVIQMVYVYSLRGGLIQ